MSRGDSHAPVTFVAPGPNPWSPVTVAILCRCGLQRLIPVVHHNDVHPLDRFTRALRVGHEAGWWPPPEVDDDKAGEAVA